MRTLLGLFLVSMVSGDDPTFHGHLDGSVLLRCECPGRNLEKNVEWQTEGPNSMQVFKHEGDTSEPKGRYKDRIRVFLSENRENCSLFLTNITAEDQGKYRCKFHRDNVYTAIFVYLNVSAPATAPAPPTGQPNVEAPPTADRRLLCLIIIPIMLVLGLSLLWWHRWNSSQSLQRIQEVETDKFYC